MAEWTDAEGGAGAEGGVDAPAFDGVSGGQVSPWRARDLILAHAAITDVEGRWFLVDHRASRAAQGWAGADTSRMNVWLEDWRISDGAAHGRDGAIPEVDAGFMLKVPDSSTTGRFGLDLRLGSRRPPVLHGAAGLSPTDGRPEPHASWYLSLPRLESQGTLTVDGERFQVSGFTWMDHEFFSGGLSEGQVGWDWFSARLQDGRDLMLYRMRRHDGSTDYLAGTIVSADGASWRAVDPRGATFQPMARWTSPAGGASYPIAWRVRLPAERLELETRTPLPAQELRTEGVTFNYWEGLVDYEGTWGGEQVRGEGYLEMTGYEAPLELQ
jgi:predicted secreted hydrolase